MDKLDEVKELHEKINKLQGLLKQSEKMASLGNAVAGIAHEINTPIGAIKASIGNLDNSLENLIEGYLLHGKAKVYKEDDLLIKIYEMTKDVSNELSSRDKRTLRKEFTKKLDEAGIDDSRTIADILVYSGVRIDIDQLIPLMKKDDLMKTLEIAKSIASIKKNHITIGLAVDKAAKTVGALKKYVHKDSFEEKIDFNVVEGIETVLTIYHNLIKQGIDVERDFDEVPMINGNPDEVTQVWTNIIHNAIQAMDNNGSLKITVKNLETKMRISFQDDGPGISDEIKDKIFEPFFTTKPAGVGSGMGLDIARNIVEDHNGTINLESKLGEGTIFNIEFPINQ